MTGPNNASNNNESLLAERLLAAIGEVVIFSAVDRSLGPMHTAKLERDSIRHRLPAFPVEIASLMTPEGTETIAADYSCVVGQDFAADSTPGSEIGAQGSVFFKRTEHATIGAEKRGHPLETKSQVQYFIGKSSVGALYLERIAPQAPPEGQPVPEYAIDSQAELQLPEPATPTSQEVDAVIDYIRLLPRL